MSEAKFTKGEWVVYQSHDDADFAPKRCDSVIVGMASYNDNPYQHYTIHKIEIEGDDGDEEMIANAHLIAAAPEMYNALNDLVNQFGARRYDEYEYEIIKQAEIVLAKARGEHNGN